MRAGRGAKGKFRSIAPEVRSIFGVSDSEVRSISGVGDGVGDRMRAR